MKKFLMTLAAVLCCAMMTTTLTACGGDDSNTPEEPDNTPAYVEMTFTFWGTQDMLDIADMTVTYNDGTGAKTETVTTKDWVKTIKAKLPASFKFERKGDLKAGVTLSNDQNYSFTTSHYVQYKVLTANGTTRKSGTAGSIGKPNSLSGDKVSYSITSGQLNSSYSYDFAQDGSCPQLDFPKE